MNQAPRILIVDDDPAVTELLELKLDGLFEVQVTNSPQDVQRIARSWRPHVVLCDIDMPVLDGGEVCRRLRDDPATTHIPVLYLTGMVSSEEVRALGGELGGEPGMSKSASVHEIVQRIAALLPSAV